MKPGVGFGLIGVGGFGQFHLEAIRRLQNEGRFRLLAVADPTIGGHPQLTAELRNSKIRLYEDHCEMLLREPEIKAVSIAAPIPFHFEIARQCIDTGLFVYLEKPAVPLYDQLEQLIEADTHRRVAVGFQMIESLWSRQVKNWIVAGDLGQLKEIRVAACWPRPSVYYERASWAGRMMSSHRPVFDGPATNALAHLIQNGLFFAGDELEEFAVPEEIRGELYRARPIESYDTVCLHGRFASGLSLFAALTHATEKVLPFQIEVRGSKGWARITNDGTTLESSLGSRACAQPFTDLMAKSFAAFADYVQGRRRRPPVLLRDVRGYTLATNALLLSSGGIHKIGESWCRRVDSPEGSLCSVEGLHAVIADSLCEPQLFSTRDLSWAVKTSTVSIRNIEEDPTLVRDELAKYSRAVRTTAKTPVLAKG